jgi:sec-independent protein translocase protein TatA
MDVNRVIEAPSIKKSSGEYLLVPVSSGSSRPLRDILKAAKSACARKENFMEGLFQPTHLLVILVIALFVFGPKKLPELGQGLGKGIRSFRDSMRNVTAEEPEKVEPSAKSGEQPK